MRGDVKGEDKEGRGKREGRQGKGKVDGWMEDQEEKQKVKVN